MMGNMELLALAVPCPGNEQLQGLRGGGDGLRIPGINLDPSEGPQILRMDPRSWEWALDLGNGLWIPGMDSTS